MDNKREMHGILYSLPQVVLLNEAGLGVAELAARTCYDSFDQSENEAITQAYNSIKDGLICEMELSNMHHIESSELLDKLAWTHFHHSILEHVTLSYFISGTSRAVLMEHSRHRIQSISVRSTRYTMHSVLNAFVATFPMNDYTQAMVTFINKIKEYDMFVVNDELESLEIHQLFDKLHEQRKILGVDKFLELAISKDALANYRGRAVSDYNYVLDLLNNSKNKRNVGDAFKWVVTDNWKVDMVITFNIRSLKNFFGLRDSNSAYFQMRWLAEAIKDATPEKYLKLIHNDYRHRERTETV